MWSIPATDSAGEELSSNISILPNISHQTTKVHLPCDVSMFQPMFQSQTRGVSTLLTKRILTLTEVL